MDIFKNSPAKLCGYFSIKSDREYDKKSPSSALRYFKKPQHFPLDLNEGLGSMKKKPESYYQEKIDRILTYIVENKIDLSVGSDLYQGPTNKSSSDRQIKYVTYRGIISKILDSPYSIYYTDYSILATKYKNIIYLGQLTRGVMKDNSNNIFAMYGPKFEQYCLTENPHEKPDLTQDVDACTQFFGVFTRKLVDRNFMFAGVINGVMSDDPIDLDQNNKSKLNFIELKVVPDIKSSRRRLFNFQKNKCRNVWLQSYLTGVNDVYFGMRSNDGMILRIDHYTTDNLLQIKRGWNPFGCFNFLDDFLKLVETKMQGIDCPFTVFEFNLARTIDNVDCTKHHGKSELSLLPDWYLKYVKA